MKKYQLMYTHISGENRILKYNILKEFLEALEKASEDVFIVQQTIDFKTFQHEHPIPHLQKG